MYTDEIGVVSALLRRETLSDEQKEKAAEMVASGYLKRDESGLLSPTMPVLTAEQYNAFKSRIAETFGAFLLDYQKKLKSYVSGYVKLFPAQVREAANRNGYYLFIAMFPKIAAVWQQQGKLNIPNGTICDVLLEHD
jgi:hypothetical protein